MLLRDPLSDLFTRIRNGQNAHRASILHPQSRFVTAVLQVLIDQGYLTGMRVVPPATPRDPQFNHIEIFLKYDAEGNGAIRKIRRVSKPSNRIFRGIDELPLSANGLGTWILSTPKGVIHCAEARKQRIGGEVLGEVL